MEPFLRTQENYSVRECCWASHVSNSSFHDHYHRLNQFLNNGCFQQVLLPRFLMKRIACNIGDTANLLTNAFYSIMTLTEVAPAPHTHGQFPSTGQQRLTIWMYGFCDTRRMVACACKFVSFAIYIHPVYMKCTQQGDRHEIYHV